METNFNATYLMLTSQCNLRCPYCYLHKQNDIMTKEMIENSIHFLIDNAKKSNKEHISITFFGGEPTLYPELCEYTLLYAVNQCKLYGLKTRFSMITNGMRFDEEVQKFLLMWYTITGSISVQLSYDGIPTVQRFNRIAYQNQFDSGTMMENNIQKIKDFCKAYNINFNKSFRTHSVVTKKSLPYMAETYKYFHKLGLSGGFGLLVEEQWDDNDIIEYDNQLNQIYNYIKETNPKALKSKMFGYNRQKQQFMESLPPLRCGSMKSLCSITPTGTIYTCHRAAYNNIDCIVGQIHKDGSYTFNNDNINNYRNISMDAKCKTCKNTSCRVCKYFYIDNNDYGKLSLDLNIYCKMVEIETKYSKLAQQYFENEQTITE